MMSTNVKKWAMAGILSLSVFSLVACGSNQGSENKPAKTQDQALTVVTNAEFPPFESQEGGKIVGFDVDLINAVAKAENLQVKVQHTPWDAMFDAIDHDKANVAIAAITVNDERKQKYDFSDSYFEAKQFILVPKDSTVAKLDDLKGKKIGVQTATTGEKVLQDRFGKTYEGIKGFDDIPAAIDDLTTKRLDAVVVDKAVVLEYVKKIGSQKFKIVDDSSIQPEYYGILVKKGNSELLSKINDGLKKIKQDGTYDQISKKYFADQAK
ncbi:MAG TPA: basic amino acid ABC transporter substrate-binding protein [Bacillota bacterium]|nr:basic amino acid ABC transporter substrate-binding protein [Bacillota bacterium]